MIIAAVDQGYPGPAPAQPPRRGEPAEAGADDDDVGSFEEGEGGFAVELRKSSAEHQIEKPVGTERSGAVQGDQAEGHQPIGQLGRT